MSNNNNDHNSSYHGVKRDYSYHTPSSSSSPSQPSQPSQPPSSSPITTTSKTSTSTSSLEEKAEIAYKAHKECIEFLKRQLKDEKVFFVLNEMERMGCTLKKPFFRCTPCLEHESDPPKISAAYVLGSFDDRNFTHENQLRRKRLAEKISAAKLQKTKGNGGEISAENHQVDSDIFTVDNDDENDDMFFETEANNDNNNKNDVKLHLDHLIEKPGVVLCEDVMHKYGQDENVLLHELIHAFDDCRAIVSWNSCEQLACAEIRASALSGECGFNVERRRTTVDVKIVGGFQKCVQRRAALSIRAARACQGKNHAQIVEQMFGVCYNDIEPFARRP